MLGFSSFVNLLFIFALATCSAEHIGVMAVSMKTGKRVYAVNPKQHFAPASNLKLFTAAAALHYLGESYVFDTKLLKDENTAYLQFSGDPTFTKEDLQKLIKDINGDLIVDDRSFDEEYYGPGWMIEDTTSSDGAPISAIAIDYNLIGESAIKDPRAHLAATLHEVGFRGQIHFGKTPQEAQLIATHTSHPLRELLVPMLKESNNFIADTLFKRIGGIPCTWKKGKLAMEQFLQHTLHIYPHSIKIVDGSGLSRYNLVTPEQIVALLLYERRCRTFVSSLPIAGVDGTLAKRFQDSRLKGRIFAKTGSMSGVSSLSGYMCNSYVFSILIDDFVGPSAPYKQLQESLLQNKIKWLD